jgi:hypothetical protein
MSRLLPSALLLYAAASLLHHVHNAEFLADYPHMPAWVTPAIIYAAWLGTTGFGVAGYMLARPALLAIYGALGLYGLAHYALAPMSSHSLGMNVTILLEAATATLLLITLGTCRTRPERAEN